MRRLPACVTITPAPVTHTLHVAGGACDAGEVLTPAMARELAAALVEAAELAG